jgi:hypothetical protein
MRAHLDVVIRFKKYTLVKLFISFFVKIIQQMGPNANGVQLLRLRIPAHLEQKIKYKDNLIITQLLFLLIDFIDAFICFQILLLFEILIAVLLVLRDILLYKIIQVCFIAATIRL